MIGFLISLIIFSLVNGLTVSIIFYLLKKYLLKKQTDFRNNLWMGVIVASVCFAIGIILMNGMDKINV